MSKKDYQAIAKMFYLERDKAEAKASLATWLSIVDAMTELLAADNPRFNRGWFIEACETGKCKGMFVVQGAPKGTEVIWDKVIGR